jgi:hypothetical protein
MDVAAAADVKSLPPPPSRVPAAARSSQRMSIDPALLDAAASDPHAASRVPIDEQSDVEVRVSRIPITDPVTGAVGTMKGLFAARRLHAHTALIPYRGQYLSDDGTAQAGEQHGGHDYCFELSPTLCLCAADPDPTLSGLARYINDSFRSEFTPNLRWVVDRRASATDRTRWMVGLIPLCGDIEAGAELFVSYAAGYWRDRAFGFPLAYVVAEPNSNPSVGSSAEALFAMELDADAFEHLIFAIGTALKV